MNESPTPKPHPQGWRGENSLVGVIRPNGAVILLGLLCALAVVESIAALLEYRERISDEDWREIASIVEAEAETEDEVPLIVGSDWLGPGARMWIPAARRVDAVAYPDLRGFSHFFVLAHARHRPWGSQLRAELEGLPRPELLSVHRAGDMTLLEYAQAVPPLTFSLLGTTLSTSVGSERRRCAAYGAGFKCKGGRVRKRIVEVDYRPRNCMALELDDGLVANLDLGEVELGELIRGHVGFGDFNARLRSDPVARIELWIDERLAGRWLFTDDQGWAGFAVWTPTGTHHVELRASTSAAGTWQRKGHQAVPTDTLCIEMRGFETEGSP